MDALPLDPGGYRGTYKLIGGRACLDLVNTISWPGTEREHEWLCSLENLAAWTAAVGLPAVPRRLRKLDVARDVRTTLADVLRPLSHGQHPSGRAIRALGDGIARAVSRRSLDPDTLQWRWGRATHPADVFAPLLLDAGELVTTGHSRLRHCPGCDWLFEDQSRNGLRRWCDMADCGSRDKSQRYYYRCREG